MKSKSKSKPLENTLNTFTQHNHHITTLYITTLQALTP